jgi:Nitrous oxide-stimulated promoter
MKPNAAGESRRVARERKTVAAMIRVYCRGHHTSRSGLCGDCARLHEYAMGRLDHCPLGTDKPTCVNCPVHCYKPELRERIREVMRYAGPRMLWRHPLLAILHLLDGRRPSPSRPPRKQPGGAAAPGNH